MFCFHLVYMNCFSRFRSWSCYMHLSRGDTIRYITYFFISVSQDYREYICTICQEGSKISSLLHQTFSVLTIQHAPLDDKNEKWTKHTKHRTHSWEFAVGPAVRIPHAYCWGSRSQKKKKKNLLLKELGLKQCWIQTTIFTYEGSSNKMKGLQSASIETE